MRKRAPRWVEPSPCGCLADRLNQKVDVHPIRNVRRGCGRKNVAFENSAYSASVKFSRLAVM
jgi:hypothetical protein